MRTSENDIWLQPLEFQLIQRMFLSYGIWSGEDLGNDLERWVKNDPKQREWVEWYESEWREYDLRNYLCFFAGDFLWAATERTRAAEFAKEKGRKYIPDVLQRIGMERLIWQYHVLFHGDGYFGANELSQRLRNMFCFSFTGQRAGAEGHRDIVSEYANILQSKGRFVRVDSGAVESKLPDIRVWSPESPHAWRHAGAIEVEMEAYKKSDKALLRNFVKNFGAVRFVVRSEKSFERVNSVLREGTGLEPQRVENFPGEFRDLVEIEVLSSDNPYGDFFRSLKVEGMKEALKRTGATRIMTDQERWREQRDHEEARKPELLARAWELSDRGNDRLLNSIRRTEYKRTIEEEDVEYLERKRARGRPFRVVPRKHWPKHVT